MGPFGALSAWRKAKGDARLFANMPDAASYPSDQELNIDADFNRFLASKMASQMDEARKLALETSVDLSKWILTSLLGVNGAAAVAAAQLHIGRNYQIASCGIFVIGLVLALCIALLSIRNGQSLSGPLGRVIGYWVTVEHDGVRDRAMELELTPFLASALGYLKWPYRLGTLSILLFIAGCFVAAVGVAAEI